MFEYIKGIKNTLADTMSHLINIDLQIQSEPEPERHEFGYYTFDQLPALEIHTIQISPTTSPQDDNNADFLCDVPINHDTLVELQQKDEFSKNIFQSNRKKVILWMDNFIRLIRNY